MALNNPRFLDGSPWRRNGLVRREGGLKLRRKKGLPLNSRRFLAQVPLMEKINNHRLLANVVHMAI